MIMLEVTSGMARGQEIKTNAPFISIGRSPEHTIVIGDQFVSRHHGEIILLHEKYQYRDHNSTHGTILRREGEENYIQQVALSEGDELVLGRTDNVIRVVNISTDPIETGVPEQDEKSLTIMHTKEDLFGPPEKIFAQDSKALQTIVHFDTMLMESSITTERQVLSELLKHIPSLFDGLSYVAIIEEKDGKLRPYDYKIVEEGSKVRVSSSLIRKAFDLQRAFLFRITKENTLEANDHPVALSDDSLVVGSRETTGICALISVRHQEQRYLQFERANKHGKLSSENVTLVSSMVSRIKDRIENLELVRQNQLLNLNASMGVFASMIGHDIKNYLFSSKKLSEIKDDPLSKHPGILRGIERARKLARSMKELTAPGAVKLETFSLLEMAQSVACEFSSLFGDRCNFRVDTSSSIPEITTSQDLLYRVTWNLVMNAYHTAENRAKSMKDPPWVAIWLGEESGDRAVIEVRDNAGGIGPRTLDYMEKSFEVIKSVHAHQEDLINVVNTISRMDGFTNSIGIFFTAVAVNDMGGEISVTTTPREGSTFRIVLPRKITELKKLLRF